MKHRLMYFSCHKTEIKPKIYCLYNFVLNESHPNSSSATVHEKQVAFKPCYGPSKNGVGELLLFQNVMVGPSGGFFYLLFPF